jgi:lysophospholipase L1-like esterase
VLAGVIVACAIGEVVARVAWRPPPRPKPRPARESEPGMTVFRTLRDLAQPNARGVYRGVLHETNDRGIRGPDRTRRPGRGVVRIGVGGDSITMGSGVDERDTYVARLERMVAHDESRSDGSKHPRFEVLNFGISGLNATDGIGRLVQFADYYRAKVIVYGLTPNDIQGPNYVRLMSQEKERERFTRSLRLKQSRSRLVRAIGPGLALLLDRLAGSPGSELAEIEFNYFDNPAAAADFERALDTFAAAVRAREGCGLVLIHTKLSELGWLYPWKRVNEHVGGLAEQRNLISIQTYPAHAGRHEPSLWVSMMDPHPNAEGHRLLAEALEHGLAELPPHCLQPPGG